MRLGELLTPDGILFGLRAPTVEAATERLLLEVLPHRGLASDEVRRLIDAVKAREQEGSTLCGEIAIPHARAAGLTSFVAGLGINPDGIAETGPRPRIMAAFLSGDAQRGEHLALLAALARLSRDRATVDAIASAKEASGVLEILRARGV